MCDNLSNVLPHVQAGRLQALAVTARARVPQLPGVPSASEAGFSGLEFGVWYSFVAPAKTPQSVIGRLHREFARALREPAITSRLEGLGLAVVASSPEEFRSFLAVESERARRDVLAYHVKAD
jgi:tripartite-type tricarboxylate transporter receptor subunit TctC